MVILIAFAFLAGLVTILSPCILPLLPLVLATGSGGGKLRPPGVIAGLVVSFAVFTLILTALVAALGIPAGALRWVAVGALALFGLALLIPAFGARLEPVFGWLAGLGAGRGGSGLVGGLGLGATLGLVWAPCAGPILASVIVLAATQGVTPLMAAISLAYAVGAGVPLLAVAAGGRAVVARVRRGLGGTGVRLQQGLGALLLLTCLFIATGQDLRLQTVAGSILPGDWTATLTAIEDQPVVRQELDQLRGDTTVAVVPDHPAAPALAEVPAAMSNDTPVSPSETPVPPTMPPAAPTAPRPPVVAAPRLNLPDLGPAAERAGTGQWFNSEPTTMAALRGHVVIVDFWTFACYNCNNTLPYIKSWYDKYADQGLVILGVHTPEFAYEHQAANVADAIAQKGIKFPVVQDNDYQTWRAYKNHYWPAFYFVDDKGRIRHTHIGEGAYDESEQVIRQLLVEADSRR
jgi:cytochrome c biogenesis protein CcdA/thiol-disulfide isomerase/thioredoxin